MGTGCSCTLAKHNVVTPFTPLEKTQEMATKPGMQKTKSLLTPRTILKNQEILSSFVPHSVIRRCLKGDENRSNEFYGAVLFVDISGFSTISEQLVSKNAHFGVEELSTHVNKYFGNIITEILLYGGDIETFAGDALIAVFGNSEESVSEERLPHLTECAVKCALEIQRKFGKYEEDEITFSLHVGVTAGHLISVFAGKARYYHMVSGNPIRQLHSVTQAAKTGDVVISPEAYRYVSSFFNGEELSCKNWLIHSHINEKFDLSNVQRFSVDFRKIAEDKIRLYIPQAVQQKLDTKQTSFLSELRKISILFINLDVEEGNFSTFERSIERIEDVLSKYEGSINQILNDEKGSHVLATFGLPIAHVDDSDRALKAAMQIDSVLTSLEVLCTIGVTTGIAFCGVIGSPKRQCFTVIGNCVNKAARLMSVGDENHNILCDEITYQASKASIDFSQNVLELKLKGIKSQEKIYIPLKNRGSSSSVMSSASTVSFTEKSSAHEIQIGRDKETMLLLQEICIAPYVKEKRSVICITGETGIGKTVLARTIGKYARILDNYWVLESVGVPVETTTPYFIWRKIFSELFLKDMKPYEKTEQRINNKLKEMCPDMIDYLPLLSSVLAVDIPDNKITKNLQGKGRSDKIAQVFLTILRKASVGKTVVVIFDDLQYFDSESLLLLNQFLQADKKSVPKVALLFYKSTTTISPEIQDIFNSSTQKMKLTSLDREEVKEFICQYLSVSATSRSFIQQAMERSGGNPMFLAELLSHLKDKGMLECKNNVCKLKGDAKLHELPENIRDVLRNRIDQLKPTAQLVLKIGSIFGHKFRRDAVEKLSPLRHEVKNSIQELLQKDILLQSGDNELEFKHNSMKDIVYETMLTSQKIELHYKAAEWCEEVYKDLSHLSEIARHWEVVAYGKNCDQNIIKKAIDYLVKAGNYAKANASINEAHNRYSRAAKLVEVLAPTNDQEKEEKRVIELNICILRGFMFLVYNLVDVNSEEAEHCYNRGKELCKEDEHYQFALCAFPQLINHTNTGELAKASSECKQMIERLKTCNDTRAKIQLHHGIFTFMLDKGDFKGVVHHCKELLSVYDHDKHFSMIKDFGHDAQACAYVHSAMAYFFLGNYTESYNMLHNATQCAEEVEHLPTQIHCNTWPAVVKILFNDFEGASKILGNIEESADEVKNPVWSFLQEFFEDYILFVNDNDHEALGQMIEGLEKITQRGIYYLYTLFASFIADGLISSKQYKRADEFCQSALKIAEEKGEGMCKSWLQMWLGYLNYIYAIEEQDHSKLITYVQKAREYFDKSIKLATSQDALGLLVKILPRQCKMEKDLLGKLKSVPENMKKSEIVVHNNLKTLENVHKNVKYDSRFTIYEIKKAKECLGLQ